MTESKVKVLVELDPEVLKKLTELRGETKLDRFLGIVLHFGYLAMKGIAEQNRMKHQGNRSKGFKDLP